MYHPLGEVNILGQKGGRAVQELWKTAEAKKLLREQRRVEELRDSPEGKNLTALAQERDLAGALQRGDTAAVEDAVRELMSTQQGQKLMAEVQRLLGK